MHIIKISPVSFKIILTKEDLTRHGVENILNHAELCSDFFEEIIQKTNLLFENPLGEGAIDAEFFESKDGGGELFITGREKSQENTTFIFTANDSEEIFLLCKRLDTPEAKPIKSRLFSDGKNYNLLLTYKNENKLIPSVLKEYGNVSQANRLRIWIIEEHSRPLIENDAVGVISGFVGHYTKSKETPL